MEFKLTSKKQEHERWNDWRLIRIWIISSSRLCQRIFSSRSSRFKTSPTPSHKKPALRSFIALTTLYRVNLNAMRKNLLPAILQVGAIRFINAVLFHAQNLSTLNFFVSTFYASRNFYLSFLLVCGFVVVLWILKRARLYGEEIKLVTSLVEEITIFFYFTVKFSSSVDWRYHRKE